MPAAAVSSASAGASGKAQSKQSNTTASAPEDKKPEPLLETIKYKTVFFSTMLFLFVHAIMLNLVQALALPVYYVNKSAYRKWQTSACELYSRFLLCVLEWKSGSQHLYYGDAAQFFKTPLHSAIYMSNHTSYADWVLFFGVMARHSASGAVRFFLKDLAKVLPGIGWGCYLNEFFLIRKQQKNQQQQEQQHAVIVERLKSFKETRDPIFPCIFPEGTFHDGADPQLVERTQAFARKAGLPVLEYVLTPRTRGFTACVENLRGHADWIIDQTVAFTGNTDPTQVPFNTAKPLSDESRVMPDAADLLAYRAPAQTHIHIALLKMSDVPTDEEGAKAYLHKRWEAKEALLKYFHEHGTFPGPKPFDRPHALFGAAPSGGVGYLIVYPIFWCGVLAVAIKVFSYLPGWVAGYAVLGMGAMAAVGMCVQHFWKGQ